MSCVGEGVAFVRRDAHRRAEAAVTMRVVVAVNCGRETWPEVTLA